METVVFFSCEFLHVEEMKQLMDHTFDIFAPHTKWFLLYSSDGGKKDKAPVKVSLLSRILCNSWNVYLSISLYIHIYIPPCNRRWLLWQVGVGWRRRWVGWRPRGFSCTETCSTACMRSSSETSTSSSLTPRCEPAKCVDALCVSDLSHIRKINHNTSGLITWHFHSLVTVGFYRSPAHCLHLQKECAVLIYNISVPDCLKLC